MEITQPAVSVQKVQCMEGQKQCIVCQEFFFHIPGLDEDLCCPCEAFMTSTEPLTLQEKQVDAFLQSLDVDGLAAVGLRDYFADVYPPTPPPPTQSQVAPPSGDGRGIKLSSRGFVDEQTAQLRALRSQLLQESPCKRPRLTIDLTSDDDADSVFPSNPAADMPFSLSSSSPVTYTIPKAKAQVAKIQSQQFASRSTARKASNKGRQARMRCAVCKQDKPITKDNDGVHCTRCLKRKRAQEEGMYIAKGLFLTPKQQTQSAPLAQQRPLPRFSVRDTAIPLTPCPTENAALRALHQVATPQAPRHLLQATPNKTPAGCVSLVNSSGPSPRTPPAKILMTPERPFSSPFSNPQLYTMHRLDSMPGKSATMGATIQYAHNAVTPDVGACDIPSMMNLFESTLSDEAVFEANEDIVSGTSNSDLDPKHQEECDDIDWMEFDDSEVMFRVSKD